MTYPSVNMIVSYSDPHFSEGQFHLNVLISTYELTVHLWCIAYVQVVYSHSKLYLESVTFLYNMFIMVNHIPQWHLRLFHTVFVTEPVHNFQHFLAAAAHL